MKITSSHTIPSGPITKKTEDKGAAAPVARTWSEEGGEERGGSHQYFTRASWDSLVKGQCFPQLEGHEIPFQAILLTLRQPYTHTHTHPKQADVYTLVHT